MTALSQTKSAGVKALCDVFNNRSLQSSAKSVWSGLMKKAFSAITAALVIANAQALAWGSNGHRITGAIAEQNLSGVARANVRLLLSSEDLAEASTWPDEMKSDPSVYWQKEAGPWHYITVKDGNSYKPADAPAEGDAITALQAFTKTLKNPDAPATDRRRALRFIVHIIGDLHQPLHAGGGTDRGGNDFKVTWFGKPTNLHSVWDSAMIEQRSLSYSEYANWLSRSITPEQIIAWNTADPAIWTNESISLRKTIYPQNPELSWDYAYQHRKDIDLRLMQAGIRIAAYLNKVFEKN